MRLSFDPHQPHQLEAIAAFVDALAGQPRARPHGPRGPDDVVRQHLALDEFTLLANIRGVQARGGLPESAAFEGHELTFELETGTGKTYAYLRAMRELHACYGLSRFIVVVPGVAIREGVLQQLRDTAAHLDGLYGAGPVHAAVFSPQRLADVRRFARDPGLQILVINIDAMNKGRGNLMHRPADALSGRSPAELLRATRPILVLDEPQSMDGPRARQAIAGLDPLLVSRWSATHRRSPHLLYRLGPVRAFELGLVKRIEVACVVAEASSDIPPLALESIRASTRGVSARLTIEAPVGRRKTVTVRGAGDDLHALSGGRELYRGWRVAAIDRDAGCVRFESGVEVHQGAPLGAEAREAVMREQIDQTVLAHLERQQAVGRLLPEGERMKVLTLFFIDRVAHYVEADGRIRRWFEESLDTLRALPRFRDLSLPPTEKAHSGWFAEKRGQAIDTTGRTQDDADAYALIMQDKARLLSPEEPVQFIFSHSALREGWDNPNVFQICTLHPTRSELRKRQELGRGLRLPVLASGRRCLDPDLARLTVVANESYEDFARRLQTEVAEDTGRTDLDIRACLTDRASRATVAVREGALEQPDFLTLWSALARPTRWHGRLDPGELSERGAAALAALPEPGAARVSVVRAVVAGSEGLQVTSRESRGLAQGPAGPAAPAPDPVAHLQRETGLTRRTLAAILHGSGRLADLEHAPMDLLDGASRALNALVVELLCREVRYEVVGPAPDPRVLLDRLLDPGARPPVALTKAVHRALPTRSAAEAAWLAALDEDPRVRLMLPWPPSLAPDSPVGALVCGLAAVLDDGAGGLRLALLRPTEVAGSSAKGSCLEAWARCVGATVEVHRTGARASDSRKPRLP